MLRLGAMPETKPNDFAPGGATRCLGAIPARQAGDRKGLVFPETGGF